MVWCTALLTRSPATPAAAAPLGTVLGKAGPGCGLGPEAGGAEQEFDVETLAPKQYSEGYVGGTGVHTQLQAAVGDKQGARHPE